MDLGIAGKVALVTASSKGLGRASAQALAAEGVKVVICARHEAELEDAADSIRSAGGEVHQVVADVTNPDSPARLVAATKERYGALDILVANAGGPPPARAIEISDEQIAAAVNANLATSVRLVKEALPSMQEAGWGRICCITSAAIKQPIPDLSLSNLARTGLWAWAKTAARDIFGSGVTLNLTCPGPHATERMVQLAGARGSAGSVGDPGDFGRLVAFLCSSSAGFISGSAIMVDGAASVGLL
jgi:3-oxoacyl-[acyl-carrier protein] reductase